ncbi:acyl-CoA N-acetyltransferase [Cedratvirus kamchatka]|uniref:Acyl-CoA N-acetyltransferase n=1 Tax=Cedratvirus kamchatka TaxID=2716914 RepID=A0A6G8MXT2_9VIRU|nr:acyl-CoA N-acetyltransferase [Cedratvirus kamchatka]
MRYYFYKGPINLKERYPELVTSSTFIYPVEEVTYYVLYQGKREGVVKYEGRWHSVNGNEDVDALIQRERPKVFYMTMVSDNMWKPTTKIKEKQWLSIMVDKGKIIGSYDGYVHTDSLGRRFSSESFISISPQYQGKGLCREFALFTYERLLSVCNVDYIALVVASTIGAGACRCYMRAAKDLGLYTFASTTLGKAKTYLYREVEDCSLQDLDFLVFSFLPAMDDVMTESID